MRPPEHNSAHIKREAWAEESSDFFPSPYSGWQRWPNWTHVYLPATRPLILAVREKLVHPFGHLAPSCLVLILLLCLLLPLPITFSSFQTFPHQGGGVSHLSCPVSLLWNHAWLTFCWAKFLSLTVDESKTQGGKMNFKFTQPHRHPLGSFSRKAGSLVFFPVWFLTLTCIDDTARCSILRMMLTEGWGGTLKRSQLPSSGCNSELNHLDVLLNGAGFVSVLPY